MDQDIHFMKKAIREAKKAEKIDEVPIGAVLVKDGEIIARGYNTRETKQISTHHAEICCIERACRKLNTWRLENCTLYVTLEPCPMCAGAIFQSRISRVVYGASDPKGGSYGSCFNLNEVRGLNHYPEVTSGILEEECSKMLKNFFKNKRKKIVKSETL